MIGDMVLSVLYLGSYLKLPPDHARNRTLEEEYGAGLPKALEAPNMHGQEHADTYRAEKTPSNHDFQTRILYIWMIMCYATQCATAQRMHKFLSALQFCDGGQNESSFFAL